MARVDPQIGRPAGPGAEILVTAADGIVGIGPNQVARVYRDMKGSGLPLRIPVIEMVEIGAGGGSIARIDAMGRITVGPDSAGSEPGPVAYGRGGTEPTVTDANLALGKLDPDRFAGGQIALDRASAETALAEQIGAPLDLQDFWPAAGVAEMVEENMANAARVHAIERGKEPSEYTMIAFGGAAPLHAARLAEKLGMATVVVPPGAGVGSAIGFLRAPVSYQVVRSYRTTLEDAELVQVNALIEDMTEEARAVVTAGVGDAPHVEDRRLELRYLGQGHELAVPLPSRRLEQSDLTAIRAEFEALYRRVYGFTMPDVAVECVSWSVTVATLPEVSDPLPAVATHTTPATSGSREIYDPAAGGLTDAALYWRFDLDPGATLTGPAVIAEDETSTVIPTGFTAKIDAGLAIVMTRAGQEDTA